MNSQEAVKEIKDYLNSPQAFINPTGSLRYGVNNQISELVLYNFSRGLLKK